MSNTTGIVLDYRAASDMLSQIVATLNQPDQLWGEIGEALHDIYRLRFKAQVTPDGEAWQPLKPWYKESKHQNQDKILTLRGYLSTTLRYQIEPDGLLFGSNLPYAAIQHFGGTIKPKNAKALNVGGRFVKQVTIPARAWLGVSPQDGERIIQIAKRHLLLNRP